MCRISCTFYGVFRCCSEAWLSAKVNVHTGCILSLTEGAFVSRLYLEEFRRKQILQVVEQSQARCLSSALKYGPSLLHGHSFATWILNIQCRLDANKKNPLMGCTHMQRRCQSPTVVAQQRLPHTFLRHMGFSSTLPSELCSQVLASAA